LPAPFAATAPASLRAAGTAQPSTRGICRRQGRLLAFAWSLSEPGRTAAGVEIDVEVGYGGAPANVPESLRQALLLLVAHWYENRGMIAIGQTVAVLPMAVAALIAPYRVLSL
jgi:uncharacterized phiE125 gp8 family phage protein